MTRFGIAMVAALSCFATVACGGPEKPATDPSNATGTNPSPNTTGPEAGEPTDSAPQEGADTGNGSPNTTDTGVGTGPSTAPPGNEVGTAGH
jgi:hypothetical protein